MRMLDVSVKFNPLKVKGFEDLYGVTEHKSTKENPENKMQCICSVNTPCTDNSFCKRMSKIKNSVCAECYARKQLNRFKNQRTHYLKGLNDILSRVFNENEIPVIYKTNNPYDIYRIESFGELHDISEGGLYQAINYINLIRKNSHINFGWWTKRPEIIDKALKCLCINKPENVNIIYSNPYINGCYVSGKKYNCAAVIEKYPFIDGIFTVYRKKYATKHNVKINCGNNKCIQCLNCYNYHDNIFFINELLKSEQ